MEDSTNGAIESRTDAKARRITVRIRMTGNGSHSAGLPSQRTNTAASQPANQPRQIEGSNWPDRNLNRPVGFGYFPISSLHR